MLSVLSNLTLMAPGTGNALSRVVWRCSESCLQSRVTVFLKAGLQLPDLLPLGDPQWVLSIWKALRTLKEESEHLGIGKDLRWLGQLIPIQVLNSFCSSLSKGHLDPLIWGIYARSI